MDASELSAYMTRNIDSVVEYLLPHGKRVGRDWCAGSVHGEPGDSLKVQLEGRKAGVWADFASDDKGDLLDLWALTQGVSIPEAMKQAKTHFGIAEPAFLKTTPRAYTRPEKPKCRKPEGRVLEYLVNVRGLTLETINAFQVGSNLEDTEIIFPFKRDSELLQIKYLKLERPKGKKDTTSSKNPEPCLFGWQTIPSDTRKIVITEGELDAMTIYQLGHPALSIPMGTNNFQWVEIEWPNLERFSEIYICYDNDEPGQKGAREAINRLGRHRCKLVELYEKDANEVLTRHPNAKELIDLSIESAKHLDPDELRKPSDYLNQVISEFYPPDGDPPGVLFPWVKTFKNIRLRMDELSIWTGINGHGKSQVLGHVMLDAAKQGERVCIASLEIKPKKLLFRMIRQASGKAVPPQAVIRDVLAWMDDKFWIYDYVGTVKKDTLIEVFTYAKRRFGVNHFVIDSMMKCGIPEEDYKAQKNFIDELAAFKNEHECHVHLVAHSRKGENEKGPVGKMDVKGTGSITDLADNVFSIWRNKGKEEDAQKATQDQEKQGMPDGILYCDKQRNGEWEGKIPLWFDKPSFQYLEREGQVPICYAGNTQFAYLKGQA